MPKAGQRAIAAFRERFRNPDVTVPTSLRTEPPDVIYTGLMEEEELRPPELVEFMPPSVETELGQPSGDSLALPEAGLPADDDPFGDIPLEDVLNY